MYYITESVEEVDVVSNLKKDSDYVEPHLVMKEIDEEEAINMSDFITDEDGNVVANKSLDGIEFDKDGYPITNSSGEEVDNTDMLSNLNFDMNGNKIESKKVIIHRTRPVMESYKRLFKEILQAVPSTMAKVEKSDSIKIINKKLKLCTEIKYSKTCSYDPSGRYEYVVESTGKLGKVTNYYDSLMMECIKEDIISKLLMED